MSKKNGTLGDILKIDLKNGSYAFGRVLKSPLIAFYDVASETQTPPEGLLSRDILFKVWVMKSAFKSKNWMIIGNSPIDTPLMEDPWFFKIDPISKKFSRYKDGIEVPAFREECLHLERAAAWSPEHIEDRLRDYFMGIPNKWVESLKCPT